MIFRAVMKDILEEFDSADGPPPAWAVIACLRFVADIEGFLTVAIAEDPDLRIACFADAEGIELVLHSSLRRQLTFMFGRNHCVQSTFINEDNVRKERMFPRCQISYVGPLIRRLTKKCKIPDRESSREYHRKYDWERKGRARAEQRAEVQTYVDQAGELLQEARRDCLRENDKRSRASRGPQIRKQANLRRARNRDAINAKARERYASDPEWRARHRAHTAAYSKRKRAERARGGPT